MPRKDLESRRMYGAEYRDRNRELLREKSRRYDAANREKRRAAIALIRSSDREGYRDKNRSKSRERSLIENYGITQSEYLLIFETQGGACAICGTLNPGRGRWMHVDHCHVSGKIRGLLCTNCNTGIGLFKDSLSRLKKAMDYLEKHKQGRN